MEHRPFAEPSGWASPCVDAMAFRVNRPVVRAGPREFSPARHLGERGEAARGNQSVPRVHAGTAVRWAAGADLAALRGTRCLSHEPKGVAESARANAAGPCLVSKKFCKIF